MKNAFCSYGITFNDDSNSATDAVRAARREAVLDALNMHGPFRFATFACSMALALSCALSPGFAAAQTSVSQKNDSNAGAAMSNAAGADDTSKADDKSAVDQTEDIATDSWITTKVKSELLADSVSKGIDVGVKTINGVVALSGKLPTSDAIDHVKLIAQGVKGVKHVDASALTVGTP
jgi:hyperosmotically inducible protein